jgi:hypothetical protein
MTSNPDNFMLLRTNIVEKIKMFLTSFLDALQKLKDDGMDVSKTIIFIDSIGMLASEKEKSDVLLMKNKQDMTRAKQIKSLMRLITNDLGYLNIPLVATNHTYLTMDMFPRTIMSGGEGLYYAASVILLLSDSKLKTGNEDELDLGRSGSIITAKSAKNRMAKPKKVKFEIDFTKGINPFKGLDFFCTFENFEKVGIAKVKKVLDKSTGEITFQPSTRWFVKHLDKSFTEKQLYNRKIFTPKVLSALEPIIVEYFRYPSYDEYLKELENFDDKLNNIDDIIPSDNLEDENLFD